MEKIQITYNGKTIEAEVNKEQLQGLIGDMPKTRPVRGDRYYRILDHGLIICEYWYDGASYNNLWNSGNGFFTQEEAEKELARRQAKRRIQDFIIENGLEFNPDWGNDMEEKYYICFDHHKDDFAYTSPYTFNYGLDFYFRSEEDAELVIDNCEDDLRIIFGID